MDSVKYDSPVLNSHERGYDSDLELSDSNSQGRVSHHHSSSQCYNSRSTLADNSWCYLQQSLEGKEIK